MKKNEIYQYWDNFYSENYLSNTSSFYQFVSNRVSSDCVVIDIGCGTARDTIAFSSKASEVIGVDASSIVIKRNEDNYGSLFSNLKFEELDISDIHQLEDFFFSIKNSHTDKKIFIYSRFFLHAIPESAEDILLSALNRNLKNGDLVVLEFRTKEDEVLYKNYGNHYRRYIDTNEFDMKLNDLYSFEIEYFEKRRGLSIYNEEDPFLARYILKKGKE